MFQWHVWSKLISVARGCYYRSGFCGCNWEKEVVVPNRKKLEEGRTTAAVDVLEREVSEFTVCLQRPEISRFQFPLISVKSSLKQVRTISSVHQRSFFFFLHFLSTFSYFQAWTKKPSQLHSSMVKCLTVTDVCSSFTAVRPYFFPPKMT